MTARIGTLQDVAGLTRTVHPSSNVRWAKLTELCPDITVTPASAVETNGGEPEEAMGLSFVDPDGEMHVYVFTPDGKQNLLAQLTGGVVLPDRNNLSL